MDGERKREEWTPFLKVQRIKEEEIERICAGVVNETSRWFFNSTINAPECEIANWKFR